MSQLGLFETSAVSDAASAPALALAPVSLDVEALARRLPRGLRLGAMSWTYAGWIGGFYGAQVRERQLTPRGLTAYARHPLMRAVELDRTYYRPLSAETYAGMAAQVPDDFRFAAKAHEDCTTVTFPPHARYGARAGQRNARLLDAAYASEEVIKPFIEGLRGKAGPLIFQFSHLEVRSPARFAEKLHDFLRQLPRGPTYAVEVRNAELLTAAYGDALADTGAVHCHNAWGFMPGVRAQQSLLPPASRRVLIVRWLSRPRDTHEGARARFLPFDRLVEEDLPRRHEIATLTRSSLPAGADAFVLVSNKAEGNAPESVRRLAAQINDDDGR